SIELHGADGRKDILKSGLKLQAGEIIDDSTMNITSLKAFLKTAKAEAKEQGVLYSIHMKSTMMKVSYPIIFGHPLRVFFEPVFTKHQGAFAEIGVDVNNGFGDLLANLDKLSPEQKSIVLADIEACYTDSPDLAMVNSDKGITNLHVPSDVIIDASMPAM